MKKTGILTFALVVSCIGTSLIAGADKLAVQSKQVKGSRLHLVDFTFDKRDLKDILNEYAKLRGISILYPTATELNAKVSFDAGKKISFKKAWELVLFMLEQAGFSLVFRGDHLAELKSIDDIGTTPLPTYINTNWQELPDSFERVRYVYYFSNISVSQQQAEMTAILKNMFSSKTFAQQVIFDQNVNAVILTNRADMIKSVMNLISVFDESGYQEAVEVITLNYANATEVATILTNLIGGQSGTQAGGGGAGSRAFMQKTGKAAQRDTYFSPATKVVSLGSGGQQGSLSSKLNTLVILGKKNDVDQVIDFVRQHLDVPLEQGKSFFHIIDLQWLPASDFAQVLTSLVTPSGGGQSTSVDLSDLAFDPQIKVIPETVSQGSSYLSYSSGGDGGSGGGQNTLQRGSNRVVIAATQRDWQRIKEVVRQIDIPQKQVIIEALILDMDITFARKLASQVRTGGLKSSVFPKNVQAQAGLLIDNVLNADGQSNILLNETDFAAHKHKAVLEGDLSDIIYSLTSGSTNQSVNSTIMMIGDKAKTDGIWAFFQLVSLHQSTKIISRPFVIAQNNKQATVTSDVSKRLPGKVSAGVSPTVTYQTVTAPVTVNFVPLISKNNSVNLQVGIDITYWTNPADGTSGSQTKRNLTTNFSLEDGRVAILGGLTKETLTTSINEVPFVSRIPIVGSLFSNKNRQINKTQLFVLVKPTIVAPRKNGGMGPVTRRVVSVTNHDLQSDQSLFSSLKDPVSRWIFDEKPLTTQNRESHPTLHDLIVDSSVVTRLEEGSADTQDSQVDANNKEILEGFVSEADLEKDGVETASLYKTQQKNDKKKNHQGMHQLKSMLNGLGDSSPVLRAGL